MPPTLPKLSYVLLSHNREKYIRAAIESAFAQDYEGELEYIFSDDCSTDRTFDIIKECVAAYKGNRRVVVTRTPRNLHLAGNTNHAIQFVESDWVIRADDDDISHVSRCSVIGKAIAEHPDATSIFARFKVFHDDEETNIFQLSRVAVAANVQFRYLGINETERIIQLFNLPNCLHQAWATKCYRQFGGIPVDGYYVDDVITNYRARALGACVDIDINAAFIRRQSGNMSHAGDTGERGYSSIIKLEKFNDKYHNIILAPLISTRAELKEYFLSDACVYNNQNLIWHIDSFIEHNEQMKSYWRRGVLYRFKVNKSKGKLDLFAWLRCLPLPVFAFFLSLYRLIYKKL